MINLSERFASDRFKVIATFPDGVPVKVCSSEEGFTFCEACRVLEHAAKFYVGMRLQIVPDFEVVEGLVELTQELK